MPPSKLSCTVTKVRLCCPCEKVVQNIHPYRLFLPPRNQRQLASNLLVDHSSTACSCCLQHHNPESAHPAANFRFRPFSECLVLIHKLRLNRLLARQKVSRSCHKHICCRPRRYSRSLSPLVVFAITFVRRYIWAFTRICMDRDGYDGGRKTSQGLPIMGRCRLSQRAGLVGGESQFEWLGQKPPRHFSRPTRDAFSISPSKPSQRLLQLAVRRPMHANHRQVRFELLVE